MICFFVPVMVSSKNRVAEAIRFRKVYSPKARRYVNQPWIHHFKDADVEKNEQQLRAAVRPHAPDRPLSGAVQLDLCFVSPWLKGDPKRVRLAGGDWKITRPDRGNQMKQIEDVLQAEGFVTDDAQFVDGVVRKIKADYEGVHIRMMPAGGEVFPDWVNRETAPMLFGAPTEEATP